jgi:hypothetical protein
LPEVEPVAESSAEPLSTGLEAHSFRLFFKALFWGVLQLMPSRWRGEETTEATTVELYQITLRAALKACIIGFIVGGIADLVVEEIIAFSNDVPLRKDWKRSMWSGSVVGTFGAWLSLFSLPDKMGERVQLWLLKNQVIRHYHMSPGLAGKGITVFLWFASVYAYWIMRIPISGGLSALAYYLKDLHYMFLDNWWILVADIIGGTVLAEATRLVFPAAHKPLARGLVASNLAGVWESLFRKVLSRMGEKIGIHFEVNVVEHNLLTGFILKGPLVSLALLLLLFWLQRKNKEKFRRDHEND